MEGKSKLSHENIWAALWGKNTRPLLRQNNLKVSQATDMSSPSVKQPTKKKKKKETSASANHKDCVYIYMSNSFSIFRQGLFASIMWYFAASGHPDQFIFQYFEVPR